MKVSIGGTLSLDDPGSIPALYEGIRVPSVRGAAEDLHHAILASCRGRSRARTRALRALQEVASGVRQAVRKIDDSGGVQVPRPGEVSARPATPDIPRLYAGVIPPAVRGAAEDLHSAILAGCPPGSAREGALRALRAEVVTQAQRAYEGPP